MPVLVSGVCDIVCCVRGKLPAEVDSEFLQIASQLPTYGLSAYFVTVGVCCLHRMSLGAADIDVC